jgi:hypothetical protein
MSPLRDNALVFNIQLALLGIIMVVGVFYNWRALSRIEERMDNLARTVSAGAGLHGGAGAGAGMYNDGPVSDEEAEMAEAFMQNVFGNVAYNAPSVAAAGGGVSGATVVVEEAAPEPAPKPVAAQVAAPKPVAVAAPVVAPVAAAPVAAATVAAATDDVVAAALLAKNDDSGTEDSTVISKTRLRKMNAESLREICMSHGLPSDGTRVLLIDRLMEFLYD